MSPTPGEPGDRYEVVVAGGQGAVLAARLRAVAHGGRVRLWRLRRWLATPQGRRAAARTGRGLAVAAALLGAFVMLRRWATAARGALAAVSAGYRTAAGAVGAAADGMRFVLSLGWLARLLRWAETSPSTTKHRHCPDCRARLRGDARVCYRCGCRELGAGSQPARPLVLLRWSVRLARLRLHRRCPDCRRAVHLDARRCHRCGCQLS